MWWPFAAQTVDPCSGNHGPLQFHVVALHSSSVGRPCSTCGGSSQLQRWSIAATAVHIHSSGDTHLAALMIAGCCINIRPLQLQRQALEALATDACSRGRGGNAGRKIRESVQPSNTTGKTLPAPPRAHCNTTAHLLAAASTTLLPTS
jgi:hypothetical protein